MSNLIESLNNSVGDLYKSIEDSRAWQKDAARKDANRKVNLTYLIAGAYVQALEIANQAMDWSSLELVHRDKKLTKEIQQISKRLMYLIEELQKGSVLCMGEDDTLVHEDTLHRFFALFMAIVDRAGIDKFSDLRLLNMYNIITSYKSNVKFNFMDLKEKIAFQYLRDKIDKDPNIDMDNRGNIYVTVYKEGKPVKQKVMQLK